MIRSLFMGCSDARQAHKTLALHAMESARRNTDFDRYFIYDGGDKVFVGRLKALGVQVIPWKSSFRAGFRHFPEQDRGVARGAFLRLDIPEICARRAMTDTHVLYTDCDVLFLKQPDLGEVAPDLLALSTQRCRLPWWVKRCGSGGLRVWLRYAQLNSGVMVMNVRRFGEELEAFRGHFLRELAPRRKKDYDQPCILKYFKGRLEFLDEQFNWKPYWGINSSAAIVHFHGPKPGEMAKALKENKPIAYRPYRKLMNVPAKREVAAHYVNLYHSFAPGIPARAGAISQ